MAAFEAGDEAALRELVTRHSPRLLALASGYVSDLDAAHDLVQATWVRAWSRRQTYRGGSVLCWLLTICRNLAVSDQRGRVERRPSPSDPVPVARRAGDDPERELEAGELRAAVRRALLELPDRQREAVVLRLIEGYSTWETARRMGCAEGTVKAALHRGLARLGEPLGDWRTQEPRHEAASPVSRPEKNRTGSTR